MNFAANLKVIAMDERIDYALRTAIYTFYMFYTAKIAPTPPIISAYSCLPPPLSRRRVRA